MTSEDLDLKYPSQSVVHFRVNQSRGLATPRFPIALSFVESRLSRKELKILVEAMVDGVNGCGLIVLRNHRCKIMIEKVVSKETT